MILDKKQLLLYAITDCHWLKDRSLAEETDEILEAGVTFLQLREKHKNGEALKKEALEVQAVAKKHRVPFVINDYVDLAKEIDADGVHVGQSDMEYENARRILGDDKIIGVSASTLEEAVAADRAGADYIGVGACFPTSTKADAEYLSIDDLRKICNAVSIPVVAIGGINQDNVCQLKGSGIQGICNISAIYGASDKTQAVRSLLEKADAVSVDKSNCNK